MMAMYVVLVRSKGMGIKPCREVTLPARNTGHGCLAAANSDLVTPNVSTLGSVEGLLSY
jgi:hypothetical protein